MNSDDQSMSYFELVSVPTITIISKKNQLFTKSKEISLNIHKDFLSTLEIPDIWLMEAASGSLFSETLLCVHFMSLESLLARS